MDVGIIKSVSLLYLPENEKLLNIIQEYSHPSEEFRVCKSLEDFVVNLTSLMSEENSFITCYVEGTKGSIDFIQENLLTSVQSVVVTSFPKAVVFFYAKESEGYQAPPHIQNIINSSDLIEFVQTQGINLEDEQERLKFINELSRVKSNMQFHLYHNISLFRQHRSLEDCQQGIVMIREDLGRLYNPEDLPKDKLFKNTLKIDLRDLTKQVKDNLDEGVYLTGSVDWIFAYLFVNRAKIFLSMIATITFFFFSYFEPIYKVYHAFNYVIPNWEYIEKVVDKEKKKETSKSNSTKN